jgi:hypothetical protein
MRIKLVFLLFLLPGIAAAETFIELGAGTTHFQRKKLDNYWYQQDRPHTYDMTSTAWRIGIGRRSGPWSVSVSWVDLGTNRMVSNAVPDEHYITNVGCAKDCHENIQIDLTGRAYGPELALRHDWKHVYLRGGLYVWLTELEAHYTSKDYYQPSGRGYYRETGWLAAPFVGAGLQRGSLFVDLSYYAGWGSGGFPLAKQAFVPMLGIRAGW